jgi:hypothetical protein
MSNSKKLIFAAALMISAVNAWDDIEDNHRFQELVHETDSVHDEPRNYFLEQPQAPLDSKSENVDVKEHEKVDLKEDRSLEEV